jgi:DNA topoisomerase IA
MQKLVIVEGQVKVHIIQSFLGNEYKVISNGIFGYRDDFYQDLINRGFLENMPPFDHVRCEENRKNLQENINNSTEVFLATENDQFGNEVAETIITKLNLTNYRRIHFNEITRDSILNAVSVARSR